MTETQAAKAEVMEALKRRFRADGRSPELMFGFMSTIVAEVLADMIFAAAKDEPHAERLMQIVNLSVRARWQALAAKSGGPP